MKASLCRQVPSNTQSQPPKLPTFCHPHALPTVLCPSPARNGTEGRRLACRTQRDRVCAPQQCLRHPRTPESRHHSFSLPSLLCCVLLPSASPPLRPLRRLLPSPSLGRCAFLALGLCCRSVWRIIKGTFPAHKQKCFPGFFFEAQCPHG